MNEGKCRLPIPSSVALNAPRIPHHALLSALFALLVLWPRPGAALSLEPVREDRIVLNDGVVLTGKITYDREGEPLEILIRGRMKRAVQRDAIKSIRRRRTREQAFQKALAEAAGSYPELEALARECLRRKMYPQGLQAAGAAGRVNPTGHQALLIEAEIHQRQGNLDRALAALKHAERLRPDDPGLLRLKAAVLMRQGKRAQAQTLFQDLLKKNPGSLEARLGLARASVADRRYDRARAYYEKVLERRPRHIEALVGLGRVLLTVGQTADAEARFMEALRVGGRNADALLGLGACHYLQKRYDQALDVLRRALNENPTSSEAFLISGLALLAQGDAPGAEAKLGDAVRESARNGRAQIALGYLQDLAGRTALALEKYAIAAEQAPNDAYVHYVKGHAHHRLGDLAGAEASYRRAAELAPDSPAARRALGAILLQLKRFPEALKVYRVALEAGAASADSHSGLGLAYLGLGQVEEAEKAFRRALGSTRTPGQQANVQTLLGLAYIANAAGHETQAVEHFRQALSRDGANAYAIGALVRIYEQRGQKLEYYGFEDSRLPAGWRTAPPSNRHFGITCKPVGGALVFSGTMKVPVGRKTYAYLYVPSTTFGRFEADIQVQPTTPTQAGIFVSTRRGEITVGKDDAGKVAVRYRDRSGWRVVDAEQAWPASGRLRLSIESTAPIRGEFRVTVGKRSIGPFVVKSLARRDQLQTGVFVTAPRGQDVAVQADNVAVTTRNQ